MRGTLLLVNGVIAAENVSIFSPASPSAHAICDLSTLVFAITGLIFVVVEGILFYSILRFRQKTAPVATEPPQVYGSVPIEVAWTAAPAVTVFIIILVTTRSLWEVKVTPPAPRTDDNALFVTVIGRQWWWEYKYHRYNGRELGFTTANELHIPVGSDGTARPVFLTLKSADVCHSFWIPRLAGKTDLIPGQTNQMWFQTEQPDTFVGQCAEYCGTQHANMLLNVAAESPEQFDRWLKAENQPAVEDDAAREGKAVFLSLSCVNCHRVRGTSANGTYAPDLTHLKSRRTLASGMLANSQENLRQWVADPQKIKPGCLMPSFGLSDRELDLVVQYLETLR